MSEAKGPFDAVIVILKMARNKLRIDDTCPICQIESAIRILEAAGVMLPEDIAWLRHQVDRTEEYMPVPEPEYIPPGSGNRFRTLLEAMPEKEEK